MKRIHAFEWEDFAWFPHILRIPMTRYIVTLHGLSKTPRDLAQILDKLLQKTKYRQVYDLCSGSGGPMVATHELLRQEYGYSDLKLTMTDLYPAGIADEINARKLPNLDYATQSVDATAVDPAKQGIRTIICGFHHMRPKVAQAILKDAQDKQQPFCAYEISDNAAPHAIAWLSFPIVFLTVFLLTPFIRPLTWQQLVFTYLIPVLPLLIAWDGTISNMRTYTENDLNNLLDPIRNDDYTWDIAKVKQAGVSKIYILGYPNS